MINGYEINYNPDESEVDYDPDIYFESGNYSVFDGFDYDPGPYFPDWFDQQDYYIMYNEASSEGYLDSADFLEKLANKKKYDVILKMAAEFRANPDIFFDSLVQKYEAAQTSEDSSGEPSSAIAEQLSGYFDGLQVREIPLTQLLPFPNHPYHVELDADMEELIESIREHGITTPAIVKPSADAPGMFTLISGHRRKFACEQLGLEHLLCLIRDLDDDEATIAMVESNKHRSKILPSEKAFAYSMQFDAMKRQGKRTDLTSPHFQTARKRIYISEN